MEIVLRTARLSLRAFQPDDAEAVLAVFGDPEVTRYARTPPYADLADTRARVAALIDGVAERGYGHFAVIEIAGQELVGSAGFGCGFEANELELGFTLARSRWGRGYGTEIARGTLRLGFEVFDARRVWALSAKENVPSRRVLEKIGMRFARDLDDDGARWAAYCAEAV